MELEADTTHIKTGKAKTRAVARIIDREAGVVLYIISGMDGVGTVPISETELA